MTLSYTPPAGHEGANLTDGSMDSYVCTQYSKTGNLSHIIDLGSEQYVDLMTIYKYSGTESIFTYKVETTNTAPPKDAAELNQWKSPTSEDWNPVQVTAWGDNPADTGEDKSNWRTKTIAFEPVKARYIRFCVLEVNPNWGGVLNCRNWKS